MNTYQKNMQVMKNIEDFGQSYCNQHLHGLDKDLLSNDWWYALKFFFSKSFMRGRRDKLSVEFCSFTIETLKNYFEIEENRKDNSAVNSKESLKKLIESKEHLGTSIVKDFKKGHENTIKNEKFLDNVPQKNSLIKKLISKEKKLVCVYEDCLTKGGKHYKKKLSLTNDADLMMVLDTLLFVCNIPEVYENNIYRYIKSLLESNEVEKAYNEIDNIYYVGDKITTFFIRDIMLLSGIKFKKHEDYSYAFPIDTWVFNISERLGIHSEKSNEREKLQEIKDNFIKEAKKYGIDPLKLAAGLWYLGANSLDILMGYLPNISLEKIS